MTEHFDLHLLVPPPSRVDFDRCPICLSRGPLTAEHIPPEAVGGRILTSTCELCNHKLGSAIDRPLVDSMFGRFRSFRLSTEASNGVRGFRAYRNVRLAPGTGHELAIWIDGDKNESQAELLEGATGFEARMRLPDPTAVRLGELKNLYLACCVVAGEILVSETAERVREDLVAIRDSPAEIADRETVDVTQWVRHIEPFRAEEFRPRSRPIYQAVVVRDRRLIPAVAWHGYTCESPFGDAPAFAARLEAGRCFVEKELGA